MKRPVATGQYSRHEGSSAPGDLPCGRDFYSLLVRTPGCGSQDAVFADGFSRLLGSDPLAQIEALLACGVQILCLDRPDGRRARQQPQVFVVGACDQSVTVVVVDFSTQ